MKLSIIIPLYNEQSNILVVLQQLITIRYPDYLTGVEFVIVDDCSSDNSFNVISEFIKGKPGFLLLKHEINKGKGAAVKTGIARAEGDVFLVKDSDLELSLSVIPSMVDAMKMLNDEFTNGSRYLPEIARPLASYKRYWGNKIFTNLTSILINVKLSDMACGYKSIHRNLYQKIIQNENRFGFEAELIIKALRIKRNNIAEVLVKYFPRNSGESKKLNNTDGFKILWTIFKYGVLAIK